MSNKWFTMNETNTKECQDLIARKDLLTIVIEGKAVQARAVFMDQIGDALQFPTRCEGKFPRFEDWIRDLSWLPPEQGICIVIRDYDDFMKEDPRSRDVFEEIFKEEVLPFWEKEVTIYVKGGKTREFYMITT